MESERLITNYFLNQLSPTEQEQFDSLMRTDSEFREQVIFEQKLKKSIFQQEHTNLKEQLKQIENNQVPKQNKTKWYLIAATVLILIASGLYWNQYSNRPERLFANYYSVASNTTHPIVRDNTATDGLTNAFIAYESKQYKQAQVRFNNLFNTTNNSELLFYEAICYLEMGRTQLAIETFNKHKTFDDKLKDKSNWYLALAYLKSGEVEKSEKILRSIISKPNSYRHKEASELLSKL